MEKILSVALACLICLSMCSFTGFAEDSIAIRVNGSEHNCELEATIENGRTMVSLDDAAAMLGVEFAVEEETGIITAALEDYNVELTLDSTTARGTRKKFTIDAAPKAADGKIIAPLRFLAEQLGYNVDWEESTSTVLIEKPELFRDEPDTEAKKWAIARARQLTDFKFTPIKDIPTAISSKEKGVLKAGKEYTGFPYSSTEINDKFFCENVSFESFLTALANPDSALYNKDIYHASNGSTYFGIVCNSLVRYCFGIKQRCNTEKWLEIPGMNMVAAAKEFTVDDIELCDVLHAYGSGSNHVVLITGILRNKDGEIERIEASEAVRTNCRRRLFTVEEFYASYGEKYKLCRYEFLESIPPFDEEDNKLLFESGLEKAAPMIAVDYGNKSNYLEGETVVISSFAEGENTVQILRNDTLVEEIKVNGYQKIERNLEKGYYVVKLADTEYFTEFCVSKPEITHTVENGVITINASSGDPESKVILMEFRKKGTFVAGLSAMVPLTDEEKESGIIVREIPETAATYKVSFENKYGIWTHTMIQIAQEEAK